MKVEAALAFGGNIGDPVAAFAAALKGLREHSSVTLGRLSSIYRTPPWGKTDQPDFANMALGIDTTLKPMELLDVLLGIELAMGRVREEVWGPRLIDIDIIAYDQFEIRTPRLTLPHPYAHERSFVLVPLGEIAPEVNEWVKATAAKPR